MRGLMLRGRGWGRVRAYDVGLGLGGEGLGG